MGVIFFLESVVMEVCLSYSPRPSLWRKTSHSLDWVIEASSCLSPAWGPHLGASYDLSVWFVEETLLGASMYV